jgi:hypothetical protein
MFPVFLFQKTLPVGNTHNPTGQGTPNSLRTSRLSPQVKNGYLRDFVVLAGDRQNIGK